MKGQVLNLYKDKFGGRLLKNCSWRRIPSVSSFKLGEKIKNEILELYGLNLNIPRSKIIESNRNKKMNRYMTYQLKRMERLTKSNMSLAWKIGELNILKSHSFQISAFNYVLKGWYWNESLDTVFSILKKIQRLARSKSTALDFRRVYIEKPDGSKRPLGVPEKSWRVFTHMKNNNIYWLTKDLLLNSQHAYIPGKGVLTAWREVLKNILKYKYVYETDIKSFFDNVSIHYVLDRLEDKGIPNEAIEWISTLCQQEPKFGKNVPVESKYTDVLAGKKWTKEQQAEIDEIWNREASKDFDNMETIGGFDKMWKLLPTYVKNAHMYPGGFPQGLSLSPYLSILGLKPYLEQKDNPHPPEKVINYADDQIFFGNKKFEVKEDVPNGIYHKKEKCGWIKYGGIIQKSEFKFLGYKLNQKGEFWSSTRKGVSETIDEKLLDLFSKQGLKHLKKASSLRNLKLAVKKSHRGLESLNNLMNRNVFGYIASCMQSGDWYNNRQREDQRKFWSNYMIKRHPKSLYNCPPDSLSSSTAIEFLKNTLKKMRRGRGNIPHP